MQYFFTQRRGGAEVWETHLASERDNIVSSREYAFATVLDSSSDFSIPLTREEQDQVKYAAPYGFYADFDGDLEEVLGQTKLYLLKLEEFQNFDLKQARLYFTGGRGVHVEIPLSCFLQKIPNGVALLPAIFKEIAMDTYVDTLDTRIYSTRRQWRVPNVQRENGLYKVQVTLEEMMAADPESYARICAAPRAPLPISQPTFNPKLGLLYAKAIDKIAIAVKRRKSKKDSASQAERFNGEFPDSVKLLLTGEGVKETLGWNQIALQLASFALALGKTEEQLIEAARGLIDNHKGDGDRYGSPRKRERELRNQYRFQDGHPAYEFSLGGIKSLFDRSISTGDLDWAGVDVGQAEAPVASAQPTAEGEAAQAEEVDESDETAKVTYGRQGVWAATEDGPKHICNVGMTNVICLIGLDGRHIGYEVDVWVGGTANGRHLIPLSAMKSKSTLSEWINQFSTWNNCTDLQTQLLMESFRRRTLNGNKRMLLTTREGVDLILPPDAKSAKEVDLLFASHSQCISSTGREYRFRGPYAEDGAFKTDLLEAALLEDTQAHRDFLDNLWEINTPGNLGKVVGWFCAAFLTQIVRYHWRAFPLLQVWGEAGAGKSQTVELFSHMHYYLQEPKKIAASGNTFFPMLAAVTQSASIPVIFEEMKPRQMSKHQLDQVQNLLRTNYTGDAIERGGINKDSAGGGTVVNGYNNVAPIMFIGEAVESQSAIMERCVSVPLMKNDRRGRSRNFEYVYGRRKGETMACLGRTLVATAFALELDEVKNRVMGYRDMFRNRVTEKAFENQNRVFHNYSVVLTGLDLLQGTLSGVFGDRYDAQINTMKEAVIESAATNVHVVMSEAAKVLDVLAQLTRVNDIQYKLERNHDYVTDGVTVDIKLRPAYAKYVRYCLSLKQEILYDNDKAFIEGMRRYGGKMQDSCPDSALYRNPYEPIFRFKCETLAEDSCEPFEM